MMISEIEQEASDIDWFFIFDENIAFVASGGGKLPHSVSNSADNIKLLADYFRGLPSISNTVINPNLKNIVAKVDEVYLKDFISMAEKGLYSFDKTVLNDFSHTSYHLVVKPVSALKIYELPGEIRNALSALKFIEHICDTLNIDSIE